jgi:hypothetical protein
MKDTVQDNKYVELTYKVIDGYLFGTDHEPCPRPVWGNQTPSGQNKLGPSPDRARIRSVTYQGIAEAMADQWGQTDDWSLTA